LIHPWLISKQVDPGAIPGASILDDLEEKESDMFEFVETETGWRVFWEMDPLETDQQPETARLAPVEVEGDVPVLVMVEAAGLGPMAV
jgi:hypothetical protein